MHNPPACHQLDLHGLSVMAAVSRVEVQLQALQHLAQVHPGGVIFSIIVGKGLHSAANIPRVKPAVLRLLEDVRDVEYRQGRAWQITFGLQPGNDGVIEVYLPSGGPGCMWPLAALC